MLKKIEITVFYPIDILCTGLASDRTPTTLTELFI